MGSWFGSHNVRFLGQQHNLAGAGQDRSGRSDLAVHPDPNTGSLTHCFVVMKAHGGTAGRDGCRESLPCCACRGRPVAHRGRHLGASPPRARRGAIFEHACPRKVKASGPPNGSASETVWITLPPPARRLSEFGHVQVLKPQP